MNFKMNKTRPSVGVGIIIENALGEILVGKRKGSHSPYYSIPGGHLEMGETFEEAAKKEVFEDGAIRINYDGDFLNDSRLDYSDIYDWSWGPLASTKIGNVQAQVNATHTTSGESVDLGTYTLDLSEDRFLVDLNDKIDAAESFLDRRSNWNDTY